MAEVGAALSSQDPKTKHSDVQQKPKRGRKRKVDKQQQEEQQQVKDENATAPQVNEEVPQYESSEEEVVPQQPTKRRKKTDKHWKKEQVFPDKTSALEFVKSEKVWSFQHRNVDKKGNIDEVYRCNKVKSRGEQCRSGVFLHHPAGSEEVSFYRAQVEHNCDQIATRVLPKTLNEKLKVEIKALVEYDTKMKPKRILEALAEKGYQLPSRIQLNNYLATLRKAKTGSQQHDTISLSELEKFCVDNSQIPHNDDTKAFVVSYEIGYGASDSASYFRLFLSSKTLLKSAMYVKHTHADPEHKLTWKGFPLFVLGTTDRSGQFHAFGIAVSSGETTDDFTFMFKALINGVYNTFGEIIALTTLVCNGNANVQNAFKETFGADVSIITSWSLIRRNLSGKLDQMAESKERVSEILDDLDFLQLSKNQEIFDKASRLFMAKWEQDEKQFVEYFRQEWIDSKKKWFEGAKVLIPGTNDALEAWNRAIKDENLFQVKLTLSRFLVLLTEYVLTWSQHYMSYIKNFISEPVIDLNLWTKSYQWAKKKKKITSTVVDNTRVFVVPAKEIAELDQNRKRDFDDFAEFKTVVFGSWYVALPKDKNNWLQGECDCPMFFKKMICKHIPGLAIRLKYVNPPQEAKTVPVGQKKRLIQLSNDKKAVLIY